MSEDQNRGTVDYTEYASMSTEELEQILRLDAEASDVQALDGELLLYVMEVLAQRKRNTGHTGKTALEAYESFKQNYMPDSVSESRKYGTPRWFRTLAAAAAVLVLLLTASVTVKAFGFNLWETVVQWTQETFHFGTWGNPDPRNNLSYASFEEALDKGNVPNTLVPTWVPEGFEAVDITVDRNPMQKKYTAVYHNGEKTLKMTVRDYLDGEPVFVEQGDGLVEEYKVMGITYYLFANQGQNRAAWLYGSYECDISGDVTIEEIKQMIDSIQKG